MAAALETVGQYLTESRRLLQDEFQPYRYGDDDLIDALNIGLLEARRLRADLFLPAFSLPYFDPTKSSPGSDLDQKVAFDPMYRQSLVYYMVGRMQLRDDEGTTDARAGALITKFTSQLLTIAS
jgi:hypothetical protein